MNFSFFRRLFPSTPLCRLKCLPLLGSACLLLSASAAFATPFTYTEAFTGSGKIGSASYTNQKVSITVFADTRDSSDQGDGFFEVDGNKATITINGVTYTLTNVDASVANQQDGNTSVAGIALFSTSALELGTRSASFANYDLTTAIGPVSGARDAYLNSGGSFTTTANTRISISSVNSTTSFTAAPVVAPVPEPASLLLLGTASAGAGVLLRRRSLIGL